MVIRVTRRMNENSSRAAGEINDGIYMVYEWNGRDDKRWQGKKT